MVLKRKILLALFILKKKKIYGGARPVSVWPEIQEPPKLDAELMEWATSWTADTASWMKGEVPTSESQGRMATVGRINFLQTHGTSPF